MLHPTIIVTSTPLLSPPPLSLFLFPPPPSSLLPQATLEETLQKRLECEFHSASYHTLVEVVTGLRIVAEHLVKVTLTFLYILKHFSILGLWSSELTFVFNISVVQKI